MSGFVTSGLAWAALALAATIRNFALANQIHSRLKLYQQDKPYRQTVQTPERKRGPARDHGESAPYKEDR